MIVRSLIVLLVVGSAALAARPDSWHPEWGPPPPVAPYSLNDLPGEKVSIPMTFPVLGVTRWQDGYGEPRGNFRHTGIDIKAPKMTPIVAPFSGKLGMKTMSFWIYGDNGWMMLGTHLNDDHIGQHDHKADRDLMFAPDVYPGQHVVAGQFIGYVGESGDATAPHLHFEIYAPGQGPTMARIRDPFLSLKAARVISAPVSALSHPENRPAKGDLRLIGCIRKVDQSSGTITMLLSSIQNPAGQVTVVTWTQYCQVKVSQDQLRSVGGWSSIRSFAPYQTVSVFAPDNSQIVPRVADKLMVESR